MFNEWECSLCMNKQTINSFLTTHQLEHYVFDTLNIDSFCKNDSMALVKENKNLKKVCFAIELSQYNY